MCPRSSVPPTTDSLAWAAYSEVPEEFRLAKTWDEMPSEAKAIWRDIARRKWASGWSRDDAADD